MKLAGELAIAVFNEAIAEGLVLAERAGIEREAAYDVFAGGALAAPYVLYKRNAFRAARGDACRLHGEPDAEGSRARVGLQTTLEWR